MQIDPADAETGGGPHRLPRTVVPVHYELELAPDIDAATFEGRSRTTVEVREPTNVLLLNAVELEVDEAWLENDEGTRITAELIAVDSDTERLTVELSAVAAPGLWHLRTAFRGVLNDKLVGFYRSGFTDAEGVERHLAVTQFEATHARRAFPCWDEPDLKATFEVTLVVEEGHLAVSNAAEVSRERRDDGRVAVRFDRTMRMSTYLVAFVVGPLEATEPIDVDGVPLRVVHPPGKGHLTGYALETGAFCLRFLSDYYGIAYPGDKVDLVAVPDFAFGAMENLGCVTFREVLLLVDPDQVTQPELQRVTDVIAHELAHMWFGDLVTMKWWNGIWLNEAFASFMEMLTTDALRPDWDRWGDFCLSRSDALDVDALLSTRPVEYEVVSPEDAEGMFDVLTYEKGAAVVRMLEQYLGPDAFREGIRRYLRLHSFGNTETTDLWDAVEAALAESADDSPTGELDVLDVDVDVAADDVPVRRMMDSWIFQGGFPVVTVELIDDGGTIRLTQERFGYAGGFGEQDGAREAAGSARWVVPVILTVGVGGVPTVERVLLDDRSVDVPVIEEIEWVLVNTEATGFYRVRYAPDLLAALVVRAQEELSAVERFALVDDAWAAVLAGELGASEVLGFVEAFSTETDLAVWRRITSVLGSVDRLVDGPARNRLRNRVRALLRPAYERLGERPQPGEEDRTRELRAVLFGALGTLGDDRLVIEAAQDLVRREMAGQGDDGRADPSLLAAAVDVVAATGGPDDFDRFVERSRRASTPQEELRYLSALADFGDPDLMMRVLAMSITDEVRTQNAPYLLRRALANRDQGALAWSFVRQEWDTINDRFPSNSIVRMLEGVRRLSLPDVAPSVFAFFETREVPQGDRILAQHLERLGVEVALREREAPLLADALA